MEFAYIYEGYVFCPCKTLEMAGKYMQIKGFPIRISQRLGKVATGRLPIATIFTVGMFLAVIIVNLGKNMLLENTTLLDEYALYHMKYMTVDSSVLFYYILKSRLKSVLGMVIMSTTYLGMIVCAGATLWYGVCAGSYLAVAVLRYGVKGILLVLAGVLPQFLLYVPAMVLLMRWCEKMYRGIYLYKGIKTEAGDSLLLPRYFLQFIGILVLILIGCILESFINPHIMMGLLKIF